MRARAAPTIRAASTAHEVKRLRQRTIRQLVSGRPIGSQVELVLELRNLGFNVTQATVSRDMTELGLVKVPRHDGHAYVAREDLAPPSARSREDRLRRLLADIPVTVGRSGLILVLTGTPGTANAIAQAIDESSLTDQEGTLAGDNTLLVLFSDAEHLERWQDRFREIQSLPVPAGGGAPAGVSTRPEVQR
jgi:transcriptional regulator of arginine metabolism